MLLECYPGACVYKHELLNRLAAETGNHYQLPFGAIQWVTDMPICEWGHCQCSQRWGSYIYCPSLNDKDDKNDTNDKNGSVFINLW